MRSSSCNSSSNRDANRARPSTSARSRPLRAASEAPFSTDSTAAAVQCRTRPAARGSDSRAACGCRSADCESGAAPACPAAPPIWRARTACWDAQPPHRSLQRPPHRSCSTSRMASRTAAPLVERRGRIDLAPASSSALRRTPRGRRYTAEDWRRTRPPAPGGAVFATPSDLSRRPRVPERRSSLCPARSCLLSSQRTSARSYQIPSGPGSIPLRHTRASRRKESAYFVVLDRRADTSQFAEHDATAISLQGCSSIDYLRLMMLSQVSGIGRKRPSCRYVSVVVRSSN